MRIFVYLLTALLVNACASSSGPKQSERYVLGKDAHPEFDQSIDSLSELVPVSEPMSRRGNGPEYSVWGKTYQVMAMADGFVEEGVASFYGQKFHGYETSNGELFDVYKFSAAHKSLPLPSYVRVTNLENNKSLIVRVNDRGPFHGDRIIDLSYAAAVRLGYEKKGTAKVRMEVLKTPYDNRDMKYLQIEAFSNAAAADALRLKVAASVTAPVQVTRETAADKTLHKVRIGPFPAADLPTVQASLRAANLNPGILLPSCCQAAK